jgi:hypothetical protein
LLAISAFWETVCRIARRGSRSFFSAPLPKPLSIVFYWFSPPTRIFEAAGAGACVIIDAWEGIELFLEPGREIIVGGDGHDLAEQLRIEVLLIGASEDVSGELGIQLHPQQETAATAEIFQDLRLEKSRYPMNPLFEGV